jgi:transcription factor CON7
MDARQQDYSQSGLNSPYPTFTGQPSEAAPADQASAAQYPPQGQDPRASNLTPTSDYSLNPSSARSGSFPDYIQRPYPPGAQGQAAAGMAQQQSPSMPLPDGQTNGHRSPTLKSDSDVPIDPSIAAQTSPTYSQHQQYSPYTPHHDMQQYPGQPHTPMYPARPEWAGHYPQPGMHYAHPATSGPPAPAMVSPVQRPPTVSCFSRQIKFVVASRRVTSLTNRV